MERSMILAALQSLYKYRWESPRALFSLTLLCLWQYKLYYFSPCPLYVFLASFSRACGPAGVTRPCRMS